MKGIVGAKFFTVTRLGPQKRKQKHAVNQYYRSQTFRQTEVKVSEPDLEGSLIYLS